MIMTIVGVYHDRFDWTAVGDTIYMAPVQQKITTFSDSPARNAFFAATVYLNLKIP